MEHETLTQAMGTIPMAVNYWLWWMYSIAVLSFGVFLVFKGTRLDALFLLGSVLIAMLIVEALFAHFGFVRLLGLAHIVWLPLSYRFFRQILRAEMHWLPRIVMGLMLVTMLISLAFDTVDVLRYLLGERGTMYAQV